MAVEKIRVSIGSASVLGLDVSIKPKDPPTTCYLMTYIKGHCSANCGFCPQARSSDSSTENLSRVNWPIFSLIEVVNKIKLLPDENNFKRVCIQTLNYPNNFQDIVEIVRQIRVEFKGPISVAIPPMSKEQLKELKSVGVSKVGIALDGSTPEIFDNVKGKKINGPYKWEEHFKCLKNALDVFTEGYVSTHLIVGLGETHEEMLNRLVDLHKLTITVSLFAFTPVKGTKFEDMSQPRIVDFRKIQLGRYLIVNNLKSISDCIFNENGNLIKFNLSKDELRDVVENSNAFMTSGCTGCNRPYYTSRPSGPIYNYPRTLYLEEKEEIYNLLQEYVN
jgi:biotin synthase